MRRSLLIAPIALALCLLTPVAAVAHAELLSLQPRDGARLDESPPAVTLTFNEAVALAPDGVRVLDASGADVGTGDTAVDGAVVEAALPPLEGGWYVVTWGIVSEDGHIIRNASVFGVGDVAAESQPTASATGWGTLSLALRALTDLASLVAAGAWGAWWLLRARTRQVRRLAVIASAVALGATVAWSAAGWLDGGTAWSSSAAGIAALVRVLLLVVALAAAPRAPAVAALAAMGALLSLLGGGHAASSPVALALEAAHLLAASVWLGAAPAVLLVLRDTSLSDTDAITVVRRFSRTAGFVLVVLVVAGGLLTWILTDGLAAGLDDPWTITLVAKLAVVGGAVILGTFARRSLSRAPRRDRLRRNVAVEAVILVGVAILSSMLTLDRPAGVHAGHSPGVSERCTMTVGEWPVAVILDPALAGPNTARIDGVPADVEGVRLELSHQSVTGATLAADARPTAEGWQADVVLPLEGAWDLTLVVRVDTFTEERGTCLIGVAS